MDKKVEEEIKQKAEKEEEARESKAKHFEEFATKVSWLFYLRM